MRRCIELILSSKTCADGDEGVVMRNSYAEDATDVLTVVDSFHDAGRERALTTVRVMMGDGTKSRAKAKKRVVHSLEVVLGDEVGHRRGMTKLGELRASLG